MTNRKIDNGKVKPEMDIDFEQIQKDLAKFKNQHKEDDSNDKKR